MTNSRRVLMVGCGKIAGGDGLPELSGEALSHAAAYRADGRFEIAACVDPDEAQRDTFARTWDVAQTHAELDAAFSDGRSYDVASICVPSVDHAATLDRLLDAPVASVLCEKPLTTSLADSQRIVSAYARAGKPLTVAYTRRWHRGVRDVVDELAGGRWGPLRSVCVRYTRGIRNTGGHVIDLLHMLVGPLTVRHAGHPRYDFDDRDPTLDAVLSAGDDVSVHLVGGDGRDFGALEIELTTQKGVIVFEEWCTRIRRRETIAYRYAPHMKTLDGGEWQDYGAGGSFEAMVDNVYRTLSAGAVPACGGREALEADRVIDAVIAAAGEEIEL